MPSQQDEMTPAGQFTLTGGGGVGRPGTDSRLNIRNSAAARMKRNLVRVSYQGRKTRSGLPRATANEHIDVIVPDEQNGAAVERWLDPIIPPGADDAQIKAQLGTLRPDQLHLSGQQYHFVIGEASDVFAEDWDWLKNHPVYSFKRTE